MPGAAGAMEATTHPLVEKAVREWTDLAEKYGVPYQIRRGESSYDASAVLIEFDTGRWGDEFGALWVMSPLSPGSRPRRAPVISRYYRSRGGKMKFGTKPGTTLRDLSSRIIWSWSPTASERLRAQAAASRAWADRTAAKVEAAA
jgi:hypothetical protein